MKQRALVFFGSLLCAGAASGQSAPDLATINAEKDRIAAETERTKAETARINAEADRDRVRVSSLNLPSFEGKTTLKDANAAKIETLLLASDAVGGAVQVIKSGAGSGPFVVLAGDEALDFSIADSIAREVGNVNDLLRAALNQPTPDRGDLSLGIAAVSALAGLLRSEAEVSGADLGSNLSNRLLAAAVASQVGGYLPGAIIRAPVAVANEPTDSLFNNWNTMLDLARDAATARKALGDKPKERDKAHAATLDKALERYKALYDRASTANAQGIAPITAAVRLDRLSREKPKILRVYTEFVGGTFVSTKNIATFLGADPMKASGGALVSYTITDPSSGKVEKHHLIACRSAYTSLRDIQSDRWRKADQPRQERCQTVI